MKKRLLWVGLVLLLAVPLVLLLEDFTRQVLLVEILSIIWSLRILFESLPQVPLWTLFLLVVLFIAVRSLSEGQPPALALRKVHRKREGRVYALSRQIERSASSEYFRWILARRLRTLILAVLAYRRRIPAGQANQFLNASKLDAPPEVQAYLQAGLTPIYSLPTGLLSRLWQRLSPSVRNTTIDPELEQVVRFMEAQMEVSHDH